MDKKIVGHILPQSFYRSMLVFFGQMGQVAINYQYALEKADSYIESQRTELWDGEYIEADNDAYPSRKFEEVHDALLHLNDEVIFCYSHILKIQNFMPALHRHFGDGIRFLKNEKDNEEPSRYVDIEFNKLSDPQNLYDNIKLCLDHTYSRLYVLREYMDKESERRKFINTQNDSFTKLFCNGREAELDDMYSRLEYNYYKKTGVTLGFFDSRPDVAKWIAEHRRTPEQYNRIIQWLEEPKIGKFDIFPAIRLAYKPNTADQKNDIIRAIARDLDGPIPTQGILLGAPQTRRNNQQFAHRP